MMTVNDVKGLTGTLSFRLGVLGAVLTNRFADRIATLDLKPKHAGALAALSTGGGVSQQELAARMGVAPSLMVTFADHLEELGAIERVRDPDDRRRQNLSLTKKGRELLAECTRIAQRIDDELTAEVDGADRLHDLLGTLAAREGLP